MELFRWLAIWLFVLCCKLRKASNPVVSHSLKGHRAQVGSLKRKALGQKGERLAAQVWMRTFRLLDLETSALTSWSMKSQQIQPIQFRVSEI